MTYVIIHGRGLAGLGAAAPAAGVSKAFQEQIDMGRAALRELSAKALIVRRSTNEQIVGMGEAAGKFADVTGPRLLDEALASGDAAKVVRVQGSTSNMIKAISPDVVPAAISRFLAMVVVGPVTGAVLPASTIAAAKDAGIDSANAALQAAEDAAKTAAKGVARGASTVFKAGAEAAVEEPLGTLVIVGGLAILGLVYFKGLR